MNTQPVQSLKARNLFVYFAVLLGFAFTLQTVRADIPDRNRSSRIALSGMYKVAASTRSVFPAASDREWFMDFGKGITNEKSSGKVALSLRQNPNIKVRIMVWQVFPGSGQLYLGNQFSEGSTNAVSVADWKVSNTANGLLLERFGYQIVLHHADPADY